jgi:ribosomal protein S18 acetylase RimI-like enzyme
MHSAAVIRQVAELHAEGLKSGFLSSLGHRFLELLYRSIDESDDSVLIVELDGDRVIGFITGGSGMRSIYKCLMRRPLKLTSALAPSLLSLRKLRGILEVVIQGSGAASETTQSSLPRHELLSMVVAADFRGKGVAEELYRRLCEYFVVQGTGSFRILVGGQLDMANRFYQRMGATAATKVNFHGRSVSTFYVQDLSAWPVRQQYPGPT